jgi:hypothetical protein
MYQLTHVVSTPFNCRNSRVYCMDVTCQCKVTSTTIITAQGERIGFSNHSHCILYTGKPIMSTPLPRELVGPKKPALSPVRQI